MNLKQLAKILQLSPTTVSRALNGYPEVSEETRRIVNDAAARHGYRPNPAARRLATGKSGAIGYVMPTGAGAELDPHFMEFLSGLGEFAFAEEFDLVLTPSTHEQEPATFRRIANHGQVDAVFLSRPIENDQRIDLLDTLKLPYIVHGRSEGVSTPYPFVDIDNEGAFHDATRLLLQFGHRRIAVLNGEANATFAIHRRRGYATALAGAGLTLDERHHLNDDMTEEYGYRAAARLLDEPPAPTAFVCSSLIVALGVIRLVNFRGLQVGKDISIIAHDDVFPYLKPENFSTPLTTTRSSIRSAGRRIAERLSARLTGVETGPVGEVWPVELIIRASAGPVS